MIRLAVILGVIGAAAPAQAQTARQSFDSAIEQMMNGEQAEAAAALVRVAEQFGDHAVADDALFTAAELYEESLRDPALAATLYQRLIREYPDSRLVDAARARLGALLPHVASDESAAALAEFLAIKSARAEIGAGEAIRRAESVLAQHGEWAGAGEVALWLGGEYERATRWADAARAYRAAGESSDPDVAFSAGLAAARLATTRGQFELAERTIAGLQPGRDAARARALGDARSDLNAARGRSTLAMVAMLLLVLGIGALAVSLRVGARSWTAAARALSKPPTEAVFLAPICVLLVIASATGFPQIASAVAVICIGGLAVTWLSGVGLRMHGSRRAVVGHAIGAAAAISCICYIALYRAHLIDIIAQTVVFGPDL